MMIGKKNQDKLLEAKSSQLLEFELYAPVRIMGKEEHPNYFKNGIC